MHPNAVLATLNPELNDQIKDQNNFAIYYGEEYGWVGGLNTIDVTSTYMLSISSDGPLDFTGFPVEPATTPISLEIGWNWIGYLPQGLLTVNGALGTVTAELNDQIKDQNNFALYYGEEYGWSGGLIDLAPGGGYMLNVSYESDLIYPSSDLSRMAQNQQEEKILPATISTWAVNPHEYEFNATMTISIDSREDYDGDYVGAFVGDQCRGIAERMHFSIDDSYIYSLMAYSNVTEDEKLSFKYYNSQDDEIIEYLESVDYTTNMNVGNGLTPLSLRREFIIPIEFSLERPYPNPFNPATTLKFGLPIEADVSLKVYNTQGREVVSLIDGIMDAGYHTAVWNADSRSSGVYFVKMVAGEYISTQKLMLVK